ncbi:neuronal tyrosine-phosphorylated phosphoinositide-3-kinase adapter 1-like [Sinocyclocheilus anshuiensis]|uniref:neuronal tyrosine-phosphorylated phosphoinositide-3-kinase adapter 1-like n=1 Tax=Sinocyclocheilus anshuiensis TaxID=1608454 RepID=UPI0007BA6CE8|nr:PREDICTED: neuronal tyrosine-phosphorylated phosphoinositide-3-kinase adapter 1-like [Sinocyclocheilus anshuiensis]
MSFGSAQDVAVENFLRDIERRGQWLHCAVIGCEEEHSCGDMNLLYRKSRLDWRHRDQEGKKSSNYKDASSATVGKVRDLASFRRHFRMGFMTMPASQDLSPHSCAAAMAPRSQSCHAVGTGEGEEMENGYYPDSDPQNQSNTSRCPPAKPKRHPNTRLSSTPQQEHPSRGVHAPPDTPPPPPPNHPLKHPEKRNAMKKSDSGEMPGRKVPPLKPKRSPSTHLSFDTPPPRVPPPTTPHPFQSSEPSPRGEGGDDEPVYIEMVGQVFTRETHSAPTPHPLTPSATTPDSESDHGEAIYEEMKYPLPDDVAREVHRRLPLKHECIKSAKAYPPPDSPLLWTYPSVGFRRPPAYDSLRGGSQLPSLHADPTKTGSAAHALQAKAGFIPWESAAALGLTEEQAYWPMHRKLSFSHGSRDTEKEDGGAWNGSADALLRRERDDLGAMRCGGHSGIPVRATGRHSESLAGVDGPPGLRGLIRAGLPLPCQTFPACRNGELGRLGRSSSTSGVRQVGGDVQRQSSLPAREALNQFHALSQVQAQTQSQAPCSPSLSRQQLYQQQVQLQFQQLAQLAAQAQAPLSTALAQRDGKLLEVIERKRCLCKEIKAHRRPDKSLCKQDSMPILPSWRKTPEPRKTGTPPCQRPQAVVWDTAI